MNYSLGNMLSSSVSGLDPDARNYIEAVVAAGATVSGGQKSAINTFVKTGKADGWYSSLKRLYLPIWASAAPNAIDMIGLTSGTFVGNVTHSAGYAQGNGITGYFNIGANQSTMGLGLNDTHIGFLSLVGPSASSCVHIGVQSPTVAETYQISSVSGINLSTICGSTSLNNGLIAANQNGVISSSKISGGFALFKRNTAGGSVLSSSLSNNAASISNLNFYTMARNSVGTASLFSTAQYGSWFFGNGLNQSGVTNFTLALKNLWENCTGLTLP